MATLTGTQAAASFPVYKPMGAGQVGFAKGVYEIAAALSKDDIVQLLKLPPCQVVDGFLRGDDLDTGTEALELDIGTSSDPDQLLDSGVISGDAVGEHLPAYATAANFMFHFNGLGSGPVAYTAETTIQATATAAAAAGGTGTLYCGVYYIEPAN